MALAMSISPSHPPTTYTRTINAAQDVAVAATVDPTLAAAAWLSFFYFGRIGWTQGQLASPVSCIDALTRQHLGLPTTTTTTTTPDDASPRSPP